MHPDLDVSDYSVVTLHCDEYTGHYARVTGYVKEGGVSLAAYYAVCHGHPHHQVSLDVVLGTWGDDQHLDHETFSLTARPSGTVAVDPFVTLSLDPSGPLPPPLGRPVPRAEALQHEDLPTLWAIVDALVVGVEPIAEQYNSR